MFLIIDVLSIVDSAIGPTKFAFSVHFIISPFAIILGTIRPLENTSAMLFTFQIVTIKEGTVRPRLSSTTFLLVFVPFSFVSGSFCVIIVANPMSFVINPLAFEDITVGQDEATIAIGHIILPKSLEFASIRPHL